MRKLILLLLVLPALACTLTNGTTAQEPSQSAETIKAIKPPQLAPSEMAIPASCTVTAIEALNLRESPGTSAEVIATLSHGDLLTILPHPAQGVWIPVRAGDREGWINSNYCERE